MDSTVFDFDPFSYCLSTSDNVSGESRRLDSIVGKTSMKVIMQKMEDDSRIHMRIRMRRRTWRKETTAIFEPNTWLNCKESPATAGTPRKHFKQDFCNSTQNRIGSRSGTKLMIADKSHRFGSLHFSATVAAKGRQNKLRFECYISASIKHVQKRINTFLHS